MINEKTLEFEYYLKKLPLYLQNSYGFQEHFRMLFEIMKDTNTTAKDLLNSLNLHDENYFENVGFIEKTENVSDLLDKIGSLYGLNRYLDVDYIDENNISHHESLLLNNEEFLKLILVKSIQNSYEGTYENIKKLYNSINLPIIISSGKNSGEIYLYLQIDKFTTDNLKYLFLSGLLNIESIGIKYVNRNIENLKLAEWNSEQTYKMWDVGVWS